MNTGSDPDPGEPIDLIVNEEDAGQRLDHVVSVRLPGCSRSRAAQLIRSGILRIEGSRKKPGYRVNPGERITGYLSPPEPVQVSPEPIAIDVVYEDAAIIVIRKPPGLVVHPAPGHTGGTLAHGLLSRFPELHQAGDSPERPGIVHRLDKDTSGLLLIARTHSVYQHLKSAFQNRSVEKTYLAFVYGEPKLASGCITLPIARHPVHRKRMAVKETGGRNAVSRWRIVQRFNGISLVEFVIETGRTHQIRVHSAAIGHPVVGDATYGFRNPVRTFSLGRETVRIIQEHVHRQLLHAWKIGFIHPESGQAVHFETPMPPDMAVFQDSLETLSFMKHE